jgi:hypothetical protein
VDHHDIVAALNVEVTSIHNVNRILTSRCCLERSAPTAPEGSTPSVCVPLGRHLPLSDSGQRHLALALAAQEGHAEIARARLRSYQSP